MYICFLGLRYFCDMQIVCLDWCAWYECVSSCTQDLRNAPACYRVTGLEGVDVWIEDPMKSAVVEVGELLWYMTPVCILAPSCKSLCSEIQCPLAVHPELQRPVCTKVPHVTWAMCSELTACYVQLLSSHPRTLLS